MPGPEKTLTLGHPIAISKAYKPVILEMKIDTGPKRKPTKRGGGYYYWLESHLRLSSRLYMGSGTRLQFVTGRKA